MTDDDRQTISRGDRTSESIMSSASHHTQSMEKRTSTPTNEVKASPTRYKHQIYPHYIKFQQFCSSLTQQQFILDKHTTVTRIKRTTESNVIAGLPSVKPTLNQRQKSTTNVTVSHYNGSKSRNLTTRETKKTCTDQSTVRVTRATARTNTTRRSHRKPIIYSKPIVTHISQPYIVPLKIPPLDFNVAVKRVSTKTVQT